jgi:uncharacterized protein YktA (UPF0223 family)
MSVEYELKYIAYAFRAEQESESEQSSVFAFFEVIRNYYKKKIERENYGALSQSGVITYEEIRSYG